MAIDHPYPTKAPAWEAIDAADQARMEELNRLIAEEEAKLSICEREYRICECGDPIYRSAPHCVWPKRCKACRRERALEYQRAYHAAQTGAKAAPTHCACGEPLPPPTRPSGKNRRVCDACKHEHVLAAMERWRREGPLRERTQ